MLKEIKLKKADNHIKAMNKLWLDFPHLSFRNMGGVKSIKGSVHYHIQSKRRENTGTVEIILDPQKKDRILFKLAKNRKGNWAFRAKREIENYLKAV